MVIYLYLRQTRDPEPFLHLEAVSLFVTLELSEMDPLVSLLTRRYLPVFGTICFSDGVLRTRFIRGELFSCRFHASADRHFQLVGVVG